MKKNPQYIFVVGGVISGVGKGITTSSIAKILADRGLTVTAIKIDPYVNVDAGTMNPTEHGEVFVLHDGDETDQDMGNYERFLDTTLSRDNYMTTGRVYQSVIDQERGLKFKGKCVQVVPHIPMEVIARIKRAQEKANADVVVIEVGGTVGEYENILFLEAARMLAIGAPKSVHYVMVSYLPIPSKVGEMKTKPTQHAVRALNASGIQPNIIIARSEKPLDEKRKEKLSFFCNISSNRIISAPDIDSVYDVPINFEKEGLGDLLLADMGIKKTGGERLKGWTAFAKKVHSVKKPAHIAVVGKYFDTGKFVLTDSYLSVIEAIKYSAYAEGRKPVLEWLSAESFEKDSKQLKNLNTYDGILIPGGFGTRGITGKLAVIKYAREHKIPYFGLCYGMQLLVIEYARSVLGLKDASSREIDPKSSNLVIDTIPEQVQKLAEGNYGNSMRLGEWRAKLTKGTIAADAYKSTTIAERHRHRYEVNPEYVEQLKEAGLTFSGTSMDGSLMEIAELPKKVHPFFLAVQFHPEFLARPLHPHKLFTAFIKACIKKRK